MRYNSIDKITSVANSANGKNFKEFDINNRLSLKGNKGGLGQIIEEGLFGYEVNSIAEADFGEVGVELKVTPIKQNKNGSLSAKERLVLSIINYMTEYKTTFETSSFWRKNEKLLLMFYLWEANKPRSDYRILKSILHQFSDEDYEIIKKDWEYIISKIKKGEAHNLSEGDTMYLGACPKGANKNSLRKQPFSEIPAMQRAFSLKSSYMTTLVRKEFDAEKVSKFATANELKEKTVEELIQERFKPFIGLSIEQISEKLNISINTSNKARVQQIVSSILGIKGNKLDEIEEFAKANIKFKTIRLEPNGVPKEHMSFENVNFISWLKTDFEDSQFYETFELTKFLFVVFEYQETKSENSNRELYFKKVLLWNMPEETIRAELFSMWQQGRQALEEGIKLTETPRGISNNLPRAKDNPVTHIRPKARDGQDKVQLPDGQMITKQAYWLNREYIAKIVSDDFNT